MLGLNKPNVDVGLINPPSRSTRSEIGGTGRPRPPNKGDHLMMDDEMMTRVGKIGIGILRKEIGRQDSFFDWDD